MSGGMVDVSTISPNPIARICLDQQPISRVTKLPLRTFILREFRKIAPIDNIDFPLIPTALVKTFDLLAQALLDRWIDFASYLPSHIMIIEQQRLGVHHPLLGGYEVPPFEQKGRAMPLAEDAFDKGIKL